jgi:phosphopantothenoylcysteine decarboxylase/phosphopantothenate--cysteine ligase
MADEPLRIRAAVVRIVDHGASTTVIGPQSARRFDGDSAQLLRAVLDLHLRPIHRGQLLAALAALAGTEADALPTGPIDELVALLVAEGVLVTARDAPPPRAAAAARRIVLAISGAIAAIDAPALIRGLHTAGCEVRVAVTRNAAKLVSRAALEALTHQPVWSSLWQPGRGPAVPHVGLAEWAELVVVYPASATTISRIATGDCSELVSALVAATRAPVVIVPSMNDAMYESPAVQANLAVLRGHGRHVVHPAFGVELAHEPHARGPIRGPAPPATAVLDIVRHLLRELAAPRVPDTARGWEQLWAAGPADQLPWYAPALDPALANAIAARPASGRRLLDLGTGDGVVAIAAARAGFHVTATDIAPSALGAARSRADRAGVRAIVLVLDDATAPRIEGPFDVAIDRGLLHVLPVDRRSAYAAGVAPLIAPGGSLIVVAHAPGAERGTQAVTADELRALFPGFELVRTMTTALSGAAAQLFELQRTEALR